MEDCLDDDGGTSRGRRTLNRCVSCDILSFFWGGGFPSCGIAVGRVEERTLWDAWKMDARLWYAKASKAR